MPVQLRSRSGASEPVACISTTPFKASVALDIENSSSTSLLLTLPPEILAMIFNQAPLVDKVVLAMTCKKLLALSRLCSLSVPWRMSHIAIWNWSWNEEEDGVPTQCSCLQMEDLLRRLQPRDARGRPSRASSWCLDCCKYLPTRRGWWESRLKRDFQALQDDVRELHDELPSCGSVIDWFSRGLKRQCPLCWLYDKQWELSLRSED